MILPTLFGCDKLSVIELTLTNTCFQFPEFGEITNFSCHLTGIVLVGVSCSPVITGMLPDEGGIGRSTPGQEG